MRRHSRLTFRFMHRIKVLNRDNDYLLGYVADLSETGLRLLSDTPQVVDWDAYCGWNMLRLKA